MIKANNGEDYINSFPTLKKWINECNCCHRRGYNPDMPERISSFTGSLDTYYIKKYFEPLPINEDGICPYCEQAIANKH